MKTPNKTSAHDGSGFEAHVGSLTLLPCCLVFMVEQDLDGDRPTALLLIRHPEEP